MPINCTKVVLKQSFMLKSSNKNAQTIYFYTNHLCNSYVTENKVFNVS